MKKNVFIIVVFSLFSLIGLFFYKRSKNKNYSYIKEIKKQERVLNTKTLSNADVKRISNALYLDLLENATEDEKDVLLQISRIKNVGDWLALVAEFGVKKDNSYLKFFEGTLPQALTTYLGAENLQAVRNHLSTINVNI